MSDSGGGGGGVRPPNRNNATGTNDFTITVMLMTALITAVFVYPLAQYLMSDRGQEIKNTTDAQNTTENPRPFDNQSKINETVALTKKPAIQIVKQPGCPSSYLQTILRELCQDLFTKYHQCTPEDFDNLEKHKPPRPAAKNNTTGEPRATIVSCVAAGLLITSLGAAFVELYKAKSQTPVKSKPPMSRKCSLADLTVLKHNRKELVRRESILELPEVGGPLKQLGFRPPPLDRRCSFPVGPTEYNYNYSGMLYVSDSRRTSMESRRVSIIDSRRSSIDCRKTSIDYRKTSIDGRISAEESPERRHWSRLVHRH